MMKALPLLLLFALMQDIAPPQGGDPQEKRPATIRGRITHKESGLPVPRAVVRLSRRGDSRSLYARTDSDGRYEFAGLEPGEYSGFAELAEHRASHIRQPVSDPANRRNLVVVGAGEVRHDIDVALPRALAITVRVVDEWGGPLSGLRIKVADAATGRRANAPYLADATDDRGRLRVYGLLPGSYVVCAEPPTFAASGTKTEPQRERFLQTCYPSATSEREAEPVRLQDSDAGELELRMRRGRTFSISGVVVDATGTPAPHAMLSLNHYGRDSSSGTGFRIGPDGRFTIGNVAPGDYAIEAEIGGPERPEHRREQETAYYPIRVADSDIEGIVVTTTKTFDVHGRVTLEDPATSLPRGIGPRLMILARLSDDPLPGSGSSRMTMMDEKQQFVLDRMFGRRVLDFANVPRGWYVKSIRYRGQEIIDTAVEFTPDGAAPSLEVVLSNRGAVVAGRVLDDRGSPLGRGRVVMIRAGEDLNRLEPFSSERASATGDFRIGPVRAGEYLLIALPPEVSPPDYDDRARLGALMEVAERITLGAQEEHTIDLRVVKP